MRYETYMQLCLERSHDNKIEAVMFYLGKDPFTKIEDETISCREDYEVKFAWDIFSFQSLRSAQLCAAWSDTSQDVLNP
jgi:hypothetical protein